ncbi:MAG: hypothetical protein ABSG42_07065 [Nitrospirota bacterium]
MLCPFCEGELKPEMKVEGGWECSCGEFVPDGLAAKPPKNCGCDKCR